MTLEQFRSNPALVGFASSLFASDSFKVLLQAMEEEHPRHFRTLAKGLPESDHAITLGRIWGYDEFRNTLMSAANPAAPKATPMPATFSTELEENQ